MAHTAQVKDPVCGVVVDPDTAAGWSSHQGMTYSFCSIHCLRRFESDPARYIVGASAGAAGMTETSGASTSEPPKELKGHEPPYTKSGGLVAPKFGAAGSGGVRAAPGGE